MRNIPTVTKNLLILNVLAFVAYIIFSGMGIDLNNLLGLHFFLSNDFHLWQLVTYMFMHGGYMHILMNMFMLWMFGMVMENVWGSKKFLLYYMVTGIGAGLCQELAQYATYMAEGLNHYQYVATEMGRMPMENYLSLWTTVGASGAVYGVLLAYVHYSNPHSAESKMDNFRFYCHRTFLGNGNKQRRCCALGTPWWYAVWLSAHTLLAQAPLF